ncbi:MAG: hypothetical protein NC344_09555 [Bacteroidales bacterium]|nr:hypothetical protein [Bacteroidales bacterium]MCM1148051.1 hypothetical protein [Bacteroidales bacterium]MCM1207252.1 hypothetical protein [Bacillota bacterium]MCM1509495.1 hypothetical protein [Clostridium sp.]
MKRKIITALLLGLFSTTTFAEDTVIDIRRQDSSTSGGMRNLQPCVSASYNEDCMSVHIKYYTGESTIRIYNEYGDVVHAESLHIVGQSTSSVDTTSLQGGLYYICICLGDMSFYGVIDK